LFPFPFIYGESDIFSLKTQETIACCTQQICVKNLTFGEVAATLLDWKRKCRVRSAACLKKEKVVAAVKI
jgi:hypothetical protein